MTHHENDNSKTLLGFWIYLMTDCVLFGSLFATYAVLQGNGAGGPGWSELLSLPTVLAGSLFLLASSLTCGLAYLYSQAGRKKAVLVSLLATAILGAGFLGLEIREFQMLISEGYGPGRSGALSAFFVLVGTHGLHIAIGLLWCLVLMVRIARTGLGHLTTRQMAVFALFWHFLDIIWIFIFSVVYLMGVARS